MASGEAPAGVGYKYRQSVTQVSNDGETWAVLEGSARIDPGTFREMTKDEAERGTLNWLGPAIAPLLKPEQARCDRVAGNSKLIADEESSTLRHVLLAQEMQTRAARVAYLRASRIRLIAYMQDKATDEDWHGVSDAANDLRELDCELRTLGDK